MSDDDARALLARIDERTGHLVDRLQALQDTLKQHFRDDADANQMIHDRISAGRDKTEGIATSVAGLVGKLYILGLLAIPLWSAVVGGIVYFFTRGAQ